MKRFGLEVRRAFARAPAKTGKVRLPESRRRRSRPILSKAPKERNANSEDRLKRENANKYGHATGRIDERRAAKNRTASSGPFVEEEEP
jgi:hypothetical protein